MRDQPVGFLAGRPGSDARAKFRQVLAEELAVILKMDASAINPSKSLDEYGLDSIDAVIACGAVSDRLGVDLSPELLIQHRTFDTIESAFWRIAGASLERQSQSPVYLFAGGGGRDGMLSRLAERCSGMADFEPVVLGTWQQWSRDGDRLEDLVRRASTLILSSSAGKAVRLAGYSQGAQLAFAVARDLMAQGHAVQWLCLFDGDPEPFLGKSIRGSKWRWPLRVVRYLRARASSGTMKVPASKAGIVKVGAESGELRTLIALRLTQALPSRMALLLMKTVADKSPRFTEGRGGARMTTSLQLLYFSILWKRWWRAGGQDSTPLDVRATLFRSQEPGVEDRGWRRYLRDLEIVHVRGGHVSMFDPEHIGELADAFGKVLAEG